VDGVPRVGTPGEAVEAVDRALGPTTRL